MKETITDEKIMEKLAEKEKQDYQRLKNIENLAKALGKEVSRDIQEKIEIYRKKVAELIEKTEIPQKIKDYRKRRKEHVEIDDKTKEKIIKAAEKIKVNLEEESDGNSLIKFKLGGKIWKILDVNLYKYSDKEFISTGVVSCGGMIGNDVEQWKNKGLAKHVKEKQEGGFHIPSKKEIKNLLDELGNFADLHKEKDKIKMLMYLTSIFGRCWLSMSDEKSRNVLITCFQSPEFCCIENNNCYGKLFMIDCDYEIDNIGTVINNIKPGNIAENSKNFLQRLSLRNDILSNQLYKCSEFGQKLSLLDSAKNEAGEILEKLENINDVFSYLGANIFTICDKLKKYIQYLDLYIEALNSEGHIINLRISIKNAEDATKFESNKIRSSEWKVGKWKNYNKMRKTLNELNKQYCEAVEGEKELCEKMKSIEGDLMDFRK